MLSDLLGRYLGEVEFAIRGLEGAFVERYEEEQQKTISALSKRVKELEDKI